MRAPEPTPIVSFFVDFCAAWPGAATSSESDARIAMADLRMSMISFVYQGPNRPLRSQLHDRKGMQKRRADARLPINYGEKWRKP